MRASKTCGWTLALATLGASPAAAETLLFDVFLAPLLEGCQFEGEWKEFQLSVYERASGSGRVRTPAGLGPSFGRPSIATKSDHYDVRIPLRSALWRGLPIDELRMVMGRENGIGYYAVRFAAPRREVEQAFGESIRSSKRIVADDPSGAYSEEATGIDVERGKPVIYCDVST